VKRAYKTGGFIERLAATLEKKMHRFLNIMYADEADPKSMYMILDTFSFSR